MASASISVTLPDGSVRNYVSGVTIREVAESIGKRLGKDAVAGVVNGGPLVDVHTRLFEDVSLRMVTVRTEEGLQVLRHSAAHVMASVVQRLFPGTQVTVGPAIDSGFYYDFDKKGGFAPEDLERIEEEMRAVAKADLPLVRKEVSRAEAEALFRGMGEHYKCEILASIPEGEPISLYTHGDWVDLCRGPHVPSTGFLKAFKLTHVAGAYWRGDERNPMLARVYGTAFWEPKDLEAYLHAQEEAKARDHRKLGKALDLFSFHPLAPAMPFFHPKGTVLYNQLMSFVRGYYRQLGFDEVLTPQVVDAELFKRSGHYANYKENMFFSHIDDREFGVKPMNCPGHTLIYAVQKRSYRDLPIRYADFGRLHRYERSGVTAGLTRVRSFCQDDAHIFCREDQIGEEIRKQITMIQDVYAQFGFKMRVGLSTRPEVSMGREEGLGVEERAEWDRVWEGAEVRLRAALDAAGLVYALNEGDGAFYGPKIDCQVEDALGRWHQLGTIQLDFSMPRRFGLAYTNEEGGESRPVMIHRAVLGSLERFMGILLEHCGGDFPVWLAPQQVRVLTVNDALLPYGKKVAAALWERGVRVGLDQRSEKLGFKIRDAELHKIPIVWVVGQKEMEQGMVSVRMRKKGDMGHMPLDHAMQLVLDTAAVPCPGESLKGMVEQEFAL
jgi:threonyl-tRNA synthetase